MAVSNQDWLDAQYSVLGSALIDDSVVPMIVSETSASDYFGVCRNVYGAIRKLFLAGEAVDPVSVNHALGGNYKEIIVQLMEVTPTAANVETYIRLCRERAKILTVQGIGRELAEADSLEQLQKLLEQANSLVADKVNLKITSMSDALRSFMDRHSKDVAKYLPWPVQQLNDVIYAEPGDFLIFAGYPSAGKSAWALQCAWSWAKDYKVGFFSLETSSEKLFDRQMSAIAEISMNDIKTDPGRVPANHVV